MASSNQPTPTDPLHCDRSEQDSIWLNIVARGAGATEIDLLLARKVSPNGAPDDEEPPIAIAAKHLNFQAVERLLDAGASPNQATRTTRWTPLMLAAFQSDKPAAPRVIELLLERGADPSIASAAGTTAVHLAKTTATRALIDSYDFVTGFVRRAVRILTMIRTLAPESAIGPLPNELLFLLFDAIHANWRRMLVLDYPLSPPPPHTPAIRTYRHHPHEHEPAKCTVM